MRFTILCIVFSALLLITAALFLYTEPYLKAAYKEELVREPLMLDVYVTTETEPAAVPPPAVETKPEKRPTADFVIDGLCKSETQRYIKRYSKPAEVERLKAILQRAQKYMPFIRQELEKRNLPPELLYLPVIESEYRTNARSHSGAVGMWQFMRKTSRYYNLKVNRHIDERCDYKKATIAALSLLKENYDTLGDWPLALAAYNAGLGRIGKITQRENTRDYWLLSRRGHLPAETAVYVPKFLAISHICMNAEKFGLP
jgi:membrane-bound lytic murein transglycosylase D